MASRAPYALSIITTLSVNGCIPDSINNNNNGFLILSIYILSKQYTFSQQEVFYGNKQLVGDVLDSASRGGYGDGDAFAVVCAVKIAHQVDVLLLGTQTT